MFLLVARRGFKLVLLKLLLERNGTLDESEKRERPKKKKKNRKKNKKKGREEGKRRGDLEGRNREKKIKIFANCGTHPLNYNGHVVALQCFPWSVRGKREEAYHKLPCVAEGLVTSVQSIFHAFVRFCRALF